MAQISDVVSVTITSNTRTPTQLGFGTPLYVGVGGPSSVSEVANLSDLADFSLASNKPLYRMVEAAFSQNPRPPIVKIKGNSSPATHTQTLTITDATEGNHIRFAIESDGTFEDIDYTILAAATTTTVATAVELLIEAVTGVASSSSSAVITITAATADEMVYIRPHSTKTNLEGCTIADTTGDGNYDDALTEAEIEDNDFYFVAIDMNSETNVDLVAAWTETRVKIFGYQTMNSAEKTSPTNGLFDDLKTLAYERTFGMFVDSIEEYAQCALIGKMAPKVAGMATWAFKGLAGVTPPKLTTTEETNLRGVNANFYTTIAGLNFTFGAKNGGVAASGEFIDIRIGTDESTARIQEAILAVLVNADKVAFDDFEIEGIKSVIEAVLNARATQQRKFFIPGSVTVSVPLAADVSDANKNLRILPDIRYGAQYAGAIHKTTLEGTLTV